MAADSRRDPMQPSLLEKNKNIAGQRQLAAYRSKGRPAPIADLHLSARTGRSVAKWNAAWLERRGCAALARCDRIDSERAVGLRPRQDEDLNADPDVLAALIACVAPRAVRYEGDAALFRRDWLGDEPGSPHAEPSQQG